MKYLHQTIKHDPDNGHFGDCYRTCIACLLNCHSPADVPHFADPAFRGGKHEEELAAEWLAREHDADYMRLDYEFNDSDNQGWAEFRNWMLNVLPNTPHILTVRGSRKDADHCVIARAGEIIHDPSGPLRETSHYHPRRDSDGDAYLTLEIIIPPMPGDTA